MKFSGRRNPVQPVEWKNGDLRFKSNVVVEFLFELAEKAGILTIGDLIDRVSDANKSMDDSILKDDIMQVRQLLGFKIDDVDAQYVAKKRVSKNIGKYLRKYPIDVMREVEVTGTTDNIHIEKRKKKSGKRKKS